MPIKSVKMKISKNKKMRFFLMSQGSLDPKIRFLGQKVCSIARVQTDGQTHRQTDTKVNTETLFQGFRNVSIIKDRSKKHYVQHILINVPENAEEYVSHTNHMSCMFDMND